MAIEPRRMLELLAVARAGSFSGAAEQTGVSQPALSQSMAMLERELAVQLMDRGRHGARLNKYGERLAFHASALETLLNRAEEDIRRLSVGIEGEIAIGVTPITAVGVVPRALGVLLGELPNISVRMVDGLDTDLQTKLNTRQLDLVVGRLPVAAEHKDLESFPLLASRWELIVRSSHPLAEKESVSLKELASAHWVLPAGGSAFRRNLEALFINCSIPWPAPNLSTNSVMAIKAIVMSTDRVSIIAPTLVVAEKAAGLLASIPIEEAEPFSPVLGLMRRKGEQLNPIAERFAEILLDMYKDADSL